MSPDKDKASLMQTPGAIGEFNHVVFLGTFNADPFRSKIERWLPTLDLSGVALIVADNRSMDNTPRWMSDLIRNLDCHAALEINERNFGGYGNLATNLHRLKAAKWVTTLHQDDEYSPEHIQNHREVIATAVSDLGMICSEAISITPQGKRIGYPRAHWLLENQSDPVTVFLAHLKNHAYPFSGATFAKNVLTGFPIPWHSTAFPDTEIVMKMAVDYRVKFARGVTVKYLENPGSESHSLAPEHRDFGSFQALMRVFAHPNYEKLCQLVHHRDIHSFLKSLDEGITQRFQDSGYTNLMKQAAFEITAQHIGTGPEMASHLSEGYLRVGDSRALEILNSLGASAPFPAELQIKQSAAPGPLTIPPTGLGLLAKISGFLPRGIRRILFKAAMKSRIGRKKLSSWDFDWKQR